MHRRQFIQLATILSALRLPVFSAAAAPWRHHHLRSLDQPFACDFAWCKGKARALSQRPYQTHHQRLPKSVESLSWDQYQSIHYRRDHALWTDQETEFRAEFFHLGLYFHTPVQIFEIVAGQATQLAYDPHAFQYGNSGVQGNRLSRSLGFAGFRLHCTEDLQRDFIAFLGASYFRAVGNEGQYGQSARGLAINTGTGGPEEFPEFIEFYLERPSRHSHTIVVYALMDSPSITGAYRFAITPGEPLITEVDSALYPRQTVTRLGIAPCTSMYQVGENDRRVANDWRPEIHDTDGLMIWTGTGEWIWRPLCNPEHTRFNMFVDENPRGFGLIQRDRHFDHYQDDGVYYQKRPTLWIEPKDRWGKGSVQLVEIPTPDETFDNIVAFWNPQTDIAPGQELLFGYRLYWGSQPPVTSSYAQCVATRTGIGGVVGQKRAYFSWRFVVDFSGGQLTQYYRTPGPSVEAKVTASQGRIEIVSARPLYEINGYRAMFDLVPLDQSTGQIDIRLYLCGPHGEPLSETWLYQWTPPSLADRQHFLL